MKKPLFIVLFLMLAFPFLNAQKDSTTLIETGDIAPHFTCQTLDHKTIDISKLQGKIVLINFFATWCGPCNQELPILQKDIWEKYKNNPAFELIIIGREHTEKELIEYVKKKKFVMPFAPDPQREIFKLYATQSIPRNIILGKDGRVIFQSIGYSDEEFKKMENLIADALK